MLFTGTPLLHQPMSTKYVTFTHQCSLFSTTFLSTGKPGIDLLTPHALYASGILGSDDSGPWQHVTVLLAELSNTTCMSPYWLIILADLVGGNRCSRGMPGT